MKSTYAQSLTLAFEEHLTTYFFKFRQSWHTTVVYSPPLRDFKTLQLCQNVISNKSTKGQEWQTPGKVFNPKKLGELVFFKFSEVQPAALGVDGTKTSFSLRHTSAAKFLRFGSSIPSSAEGVLPWTTNLPNMEPVLGYSARSGEAENGHHQKPGVFPKDRTGVFLWSKFGNPTKSTYPKDPDMP